ncbi:MAG: DNA cytosine methyltransferase [Mesorhizobium sp.]|nr:MAG: DNA cytosine methyltransferase [Mesorhizobium sp.]
MGTDFKYYEFFAGAGMARAGLGDGWKCLYANDCDKLKQISYAENWGKDDFDGRDVAVVQTCDLKGMVDLAWASFPCQDLSQAGAKRGIGEADGNAATRSGAVWPFLGLIRSLAGEGRHPVLLALENVVGLLYANGGADFRAICAALSEIGYRFGALMADASHFVPQSRPRVFIVAMRRDVPLPAEVRADLPANPWHTQILQRARAGLGPAEAANWVWWNPGDPPAGMNVQLADVIDLSDDAEWNTDDATNRLLGMMSEAQLTRLAEAKAVGQPVIGSLYLRMRPNGKGGNVQRAEVAFGKTLGCLRTPKGGASRPRIVVVEGERVRTRLLSEREAASLMGLGKAFILPKTYNECFRLIGDGVVPAVVRFLANTLLEPLATHAKSFVSQSADQKASA